MYQYTNTQLLNSIHFSGEECISYPAMDVTLFYMDKWLTCVIPSALIILHSPIYAIKKDVL